eukprot:gene18983-24796_t
MELIILFN